MAKRSKTRKTTSIPPAEVARTATVGCVDTPVRKAETLLRTAWYTRDWLWGLVLAVAIFLTYLPVRTGGFVWDDDDHITANPTVIGPLGLKEIWTTSAGDISPLTRSTFWLEHKLWGLSPLPFHLMTVLLHAVCALLLWQVLRRLRVPGAWLGAAIWSLHPVQVESVAWITEMKNTESGLFFLLSILFYTEEIRRGESSGHNTGDPETGLGWRYALTLIFAALAMAAKVSTVVLPASLCLCACWLEGRWRWRNLLRVIPVAIMSLLSSAFVIWTQGKREGMSHDHPLVGTLWERVIGAADAVWFYLGKLVWPHPLMAMYPIWKIDAGRWLSWLPLAILIGMLLALWPSRRTQFTAWTRPGFFVLAWFITALFPALGLVDSYTYRYSGGYSPVYLHFQYLAGMAPLALAGACLVRFTDFAIPRKAWMRAIPAGILLLVLAVASNQRAWAFQTNRTLWSDAVAGNPDCWSCHYNLGIEFQQGGQSDEAIAEYRRTLSINPDAPKAHNNLGIALAQKGRDDEAIDHFRRALAIDPGNVDAHYNLGSALLRKGQGDEAREQFEMVLKVNPRQVDARAYIGAILDLKGQTNAAIEQYELALSIDPNDAVVHHNLGLDLARLGRQDDAIAHFQKAIGIDPGYVQAHNDLGVALAQRRQFSEAISEFQAALRLNPEDRTAQDYLARAQAAQANEQGSVARASGSN